MSDEPEREPIRSAGITSISGFERQAHAAKAQAKAAKQFAKRAKLEARLAKQRAKLDSTEAKLRVRETKQAKAEEDLELAQHGQKRSFWHPFSGKVVSVSQSRRARAHSRRLFGFGRKEE